MLRPGKVTGTSDRETETAETGTETETGIAGTRRGRVLVGGLAENWSWRPWGETERWRDGEPERERKENAREREREREGSK